MNSANRPSLPLKIQPLIPEWTSPSQTCCNANALPNHSRSLLRRLKYIFQAYLIRHLMLFLMEKLKNVSKLQFARVSLFPSETLPVLQEQWHSSRVPAMLSTTWLCQFAVTGTTPSGAHRTLVKADDRSRGGRQSHHSRSCLGSGRAALRAVGSLGIAPSDSHHHPHFLYF